MTLLDAPTSPPPTAAAIAATLEITYLRPMLESLPEERKWALDVGAHKGDVTEALADLGYKILAVEPQDYMADRFTKRHGRRMESGQVILARCAVSDQPGHADLIIGSASTVSTLEPLWTSVAFPEEFRKRRSVRVELRPLAELLAEHDFGPIGLAKVDVEGHELPALRGLLRPGVTPPLAIMFEACQCFAPQAIDCLRFLRSHGYRAFDIFVRIGEALIAAERFTDAELPGAWSACGGRFFYANIVAYHDSMPASITMPDPAAFLADYQLNEAAPLPLRAEQRTSVKGETALTAPHPSTPIAGESPASEPQWFIDDFIRFRDLSAGKERGLPLKWEERQPQLEDRTPRLGFDRHYIYHTAWAARILAGTKPSRHVDISSTLYFCAIASAFVPVDYYEYRPVQLALDNLTTGVADLQHLPFADRSVASLSCMHVIEHIGLGRYGDPIDPDGDRKAGAELARVLAPGGSLLLVAPVGRPRIVFNGHRIYSAAHVRAMCPGLELAEFALVPDGRHNRGLVLNPEDDFVNEQNYGCGCFHFRRNTP